MLRWYEYHQVYHPDRQMIAAAADLGRPFEDVFFRAADGTELNGWFFPAAFNSGRKAVAVLVCHGNGGNISYRLELCEALLQTGVNVFLFDYRGYGRSRGRPSEEGTYQDALAAHGWLEVKGFPGRNIVAYGESLGGGVACELAVRVPVAGLVLQSTFTSIPELGAELLPWLPVRWLAAIKYETRRKLPGLRVPVLVMHSRGDELVNCRHADRNFSVARQPKLFCELRGGHNEAVLDREAFLGGLEKFLAMVERQP